LTVSIHLVVDVDVCIDGGRRNWITSENRIGGVVGHRGRRILEGVVKRGCVVIHSGT